MNKETVLNTLSDLPGEFNLEEFLERLVFIEKIEKGLVQAKKGKLTDHNKVVEHFRKRWSK